VVLFSDRRLINPKNKTRDELSEFSRFFESTRAEGNPALTGEEVLRLRGTERLGLFERELL